MKAKKIKKNVKREREERRERDQFIFIDSADRSGRAQVPPCHVYDASALSRPHALTPSAVMSKCKLFRYVAHRLFPAALLMAARGVERERGRGRGQRALGQMKSL